MIRKTEVPLAEELVGVVVDAELLQASPHHHELLLGAGRHEEARGTYDEEKK